jgi:hypothetical protein
MADVASSPPNRLLAMMYRLLAMMYRLLAMMCASRGLSAVTQRKVIPAG